MTGSGEQFDYNLSADKLVSFGESKYLQKTVLMNTMRIAFENLHALSEGKSDFGSGLTVWSTLKFKVHL